MIYPSHGERYFRHRYIPWAASTHGMPQKCTCEITKNWINYIKKIYTNKDLDWKSWYLLLIILCMKWFSFSKSMFLRFWRFWKGKINSSKMLILFIFAGKQFLDIPRHLFLVVFIQKWVVFRNFENNMSSKQGFLRKRTIESFKRAPQK